MKDRAAQVSGSASPAPSRWFAGRHPHHEQAQELADQDARVGGRVRVGDQDLVDDDEQLVGEEEGAPQRESLADGTS